MENKPKRVVYSPTASAKVDDLARELNASPAEVLARLLAKAHASELTQPVPNSVALVDEAPRSPVWARLAGPLAWAVFGLTAFAFACPILVLSMIPGIEASERADQVITWSTHVLAPVVGLASAVVTYYFGRGDGGNQSDS